MRRLAVLALTAALLFSGILSACGGETPPVRVVIALAEDGQAGEVLFEQALPPDYSGLTVAAVLDRLHADFPEVTCNYQTMADGSRQFVGIGGITNKSAQVSAYVMQFDQWVFDIDGQAVTDMYDDAVYAGQTLHVTYRSWESDEQPII